MQSNFSKTLIIGYLATIFLALKLAPAHAQLTFPDVDSTLSGAQILDDPKSPDENCKNGGLRLANYLIIGSLPRTIGYCAAKAVKSVSYMGGSDSDTCFPADFYDRRAGELFCAMNDQVAKQREENIATWSMLDELNAMLKKATERIKKLETCAALPKLCEPTK